jgi:MFS family permease
MNLDSFPALKYRDFRLLWLGQLVSQMGTQMQRVAIAWHIYTLTHDPIALGLLGVFRVLPVFIFALVGGAVADAQDRRKVLLFTQTTMALSAAVLAALTFLGIENAPIIYAAVAVSAGAAAFDGPSRQALVSNVVPRQHLANAFSLNSIIMEVATIVGGSVGGLIIAGLGGVGTVYALNAVSFLAIIAAVLMMSPVPRIKSEGRTFSTAAVVDGIRYLRASPVIWGAMLMDFFASFFASATTLLPIIASDVLHVGAEGYGILSVAPSIGSVIAGYFMSLRSHRIRKPGLVMLVSVGVYGLATLLFGLSPYFVLSLFFYGFTGAGDTISMVLRQTIRQLTTPDAMRGRMTSINMMFAMGGPQLGDMEAGIVAQLWGAPFAVVTGGICCIAAVVLVARLCPPLRDFDGRKLFEHQPAPAPAAAAATD